MIPHKQWLDGYFYWRGQYSLRNNEFITLKREIVARKTQMADKSQDSHAWMEWMNKYLGQDPVIYELNFSDDTPVSIQEYREIYELYINVNKKYPYATIFNSGYAILRNIIDGNFPPPIGNCTRHDKLTPGMRRQSVYSKGLNDQGLELLAVDCNAETSTILAEVRLIIEEKKASLVGSSKKIARPYAKDVSALKDELLTTGTAYRPVSDESRAVGLMLFDDVFFSGGSDASAIRSVRKDLAEDGPKNFGKADSSERQFQRWLTNTRKCIDAAEVLEI